MALAPAGMALAQALTDADWQCSAVSGLAVGDMGANVALVLAWVDMALASVCMAVEWAKGLANTTLWQLVICLIAPNTPSGNFLGQGSFGNNVWKRFISFGRLSANKGLGEGGADLALSWGFNDLETNKKLTYAFRSAFHAKATLYSWRATSCTCRSSTRQIPRQAGA
jgi:hypothetical protein